MRIALAPGHTPESPGAKRGDITEYGLSSAIIGDLIFRLDKAGYEALLVGSASNRDQAIRTNEMHPDFGLELHFNNHNIKGFHGTEVLHAGSIQGERLSGYLEYNLVGALGTYDRGTHKAYYQLDPNNPIITIVKDTHCPFVVVEPLFLSNDEDFAKIDIQLISIALYEGVISYGDTL